jgi:hypothetical protein
VGYFTSFLVWTLTVLAVIIIYMTGEGPPEFEQPQDGYAMAVELGLAGVADETISAHGQVYTVADALAKCEPFAQYVRSVAGALPDTLDDETKSSIMTESVRGMAEQAPTESPAEVKKN